MNSNCAPCNERGRTTKAHRLVAGVPFCRKCFDENDDGPVVSCSIIKPENIPDRLGSVIRQGIMTLKDRPGVALRLVPEKVSGSQVQTWLHTYAERYGISITTKKVDGVVYVERNMKGKRELAMRA